MPGEAALDRGRKARAEDGHATGSDTQAVRPLRLLHHAEAQERQNEGRESGLEEGPERAYI